MPIYPRQNRKGETVYDIVISQGRKRVWYRNIATSSRQARIEETRLLHARDQGIDISPSKLTVRDWLERWLRDYAAGLAPSTLRTYGVNLRVHVIPVLGDKRLRDLKPAEVQSCYAAIVAKGRSRKTALNVHRVLHEALAHAVRLEVLGRNVCDSVIPPNATKHLITPPTVEQLGTLLALADATQYGRLVRLALWTALRQGELVALRWDDIDLTRRRLTVGKAKHDTTGTISLSDDAVALLRDQRVHQMEERLRLGPAFKGEGYVFTNQVGGPIDVGGVKRTWARIKKRSGLNTRFHDLRHAHASLLIAAGVHAKVIQERLRHRQISTTMDIYGHLMPGMQEDAAQRIDDAMRGNA